MKKLKTPIRKVNNRSNYNPKDFPGEINKKPSMTIPNETMSLNELVNRHTIKSIWDGQTHPGQYDNEDTAGLADITRMDKVEQAQYQKEINSYIIEQEENLKEWKKKIVKGKQDQALWEKKIKEQKALENIVPKNENV